MSATPADRPRQARVRRLRSLALAALACTVQVAQAQAQAPAQLPAASPAPPRTISIGTTTAGTTMADTTSPGAAAADATMPRLAICADPANLPYADAQGRGFEDRIAQLLAQGLGVPVHFAWNQQRRSFLRRTLHARLCDVVIGLPAGLPGVLQTRPYYRSGYVFVTRAGQQPPLRGLDDPALAGLRIGLQAVGADSANTPVAAALARHGLAAQVRGYPVWGEDDDPSPQARLIDDVARGQLDVAIAWGPIAGYFARRHGAALQLQPVGADSARPDLPMQYDIAVSVRPGDRALRDRLQHLLDQHRGEIDSLLAAYGVPLMGPTAAPAATHATTAPVPSIAPSTPSGEPS